MSKGKNVYQNQIPFYGNGTSQESRLTKKLLPDYARIHEFELYHLLAFVSKYSRLLRHYDNKNEISGSWEPFFVKDISVILADIVSIDLEHIENDHNHVVHSILHNYDSNKKLVHLKELFVQIHGIAKQLNRWYKLTSQITISNSNLEDEVSNELRNIITLKLVPKLRELRAYDEGAGDDKAFKKEIGLPYHEFDDIWDIDNVDPINIYKGGSKNQKVNNALKKLRILYREFYNVLGYIVFNFGKYFERSINEKEDHQPDMALMITFLKLFRYLQDDLNDVSERYLNMYYQKVLKQSKRDSVSDNVHVCFELANHIDEFLVKKGTKLSAGKNELGLDIVYKTTQDLLLNQTQVKSLKTIYVSEYQETLSQYKLVTGIYSASVADSKDGQGTEFDDQHVEWPMFGEEQSNRPMGVRTMGVGVLGFAIASPILFLSEGERTISLKLYFNPESSNIYEKLVREIAKNRSLSFNEVINTVFNREKNLKNISIYASGAEGWFPIDSSTIRISIPEDAENRFNALFLRFVIPPFSPSIVAYDSEVIEEQLVTRNPVLKITLNNTIEPFLYSFLRDLEIDTIDINVSVSGIKRLDLYNDIGQIDGKQPFQPFGPLPQIGSYLLVGNEELFKKEVNELKLDIEWQNLPDFEEYYKGYEGLQDELMRDIYTVQLSALSDGRYSPGKEDEEGLQYLLFQPTDGEVVNENTSDITVDEGKIRKLQIIADPSLEDNSVFDNETQSGYLKVEVSGPDHVFGHHVYQKLFTEAVTERARAEEGAEDNIEIPNPPFTPVINTLTLSYSASIQINTGSDRNEQFFHLHPFGTINVYSKGLLRSDRFHVVPQYNEEGYLYIGIEDLKPPQTLSLLFQLTANKARGYSKKRMPDIVWSYLADNVWVPFQEQHHLLDTTDEFTRTGIIQLRVPREINRKNSVLPNNLHWLRVSIDGDTELLCHAVAIKSQAVTAQWEDDGDQEWLRKPLGGYFINDLVDKISEIKQVVQPFPSFGGMAKESSKEYYRRVSERLRHKGRAVTHWDYERLVLNKFYTIFQTKCLSHLSNPDEISKGEITLVVVPRKSDSTEETRPKVNYKTLRVINKYVRQHVSPFVKLNVRNPDYEYIRAICNVKFIEGSNNGQSIQRMKDDLKTFICPWLYDNEESLNIGGSLNEDVVLNYIKGLSYVKFVTKFSILHFFLDADGFYNFIDSGDPRVAKQKPYAIQAEPWAVIIPDDDHKITIIDEEREEEPIPVDRPVRFQNKLDITESFIKISRRRRAKTIIDTEKGKFDYSLEIKV